MRQLAATVFLGGCSFIFNPDHINRDIDAHVDDAYVVDVEVIADVDITALKLDYAFPATVYEGAGQANGRPSVVVIRGEQISPTAVVTVVPMSGAPSQITVNDIKIAGDSNWIAISISAPVDINQDETGGKMKPPVPLLVTVDNGGGNVKSLPAAALSLKFLDQLTAPISPPVDPKKLYSNIAITAVESLAAGTSLGRLELHSMSGISFTQGITFDADNAKPGAGGCAGGAGESTSSGSSVTDAAPCFSAAAGATGGGGAGGRYGGDPQISTFANATPGGGGGGGGNVAGLLGGVAGSGAGMLYLDARGDLTIVGAVSAKGGDGANGGLLAGAGGGGTGGTLLLKTSGTLMTGAVTLSAGNPGTSPAAGAAGMAGHIRYDAAHGAAPSGYIGPMFQTVPFFSYDALTASGAITLTGTPGDTTNFSGQAFDKDLDAPIDGSFSLSFGGQSGVAMPQVMLSPGYNKICATVPGGNALLRPESGNCAEIVYLPGPHS